MMITAWAFNNYQIDTADLSDLLLRVIGDR
jgi:hypothetical protein